MPPGMLHSVKGLEESISFNIDFHTNKSVAIALTKIFFGMPKKNWYYNLICALGLILKIPSKYLFSFYKSYLNYVSWEIFEQYEKRMELLSNVNGMDLPRFTEWEANANLLKLVIINLK